MYENRNRRLNDWWDFGVELGRLNQQETAMLKILETSKTGVERNKVQCALVDITSLKENIVRMEKDFNAE